MLKLVLLIMGIFLILMIAGVPIGFSLAISALTTTMITGQFEPTAIVHRMIGNASSYTLLAIPFFILAAKLMNTGGITRRIFRACSALIGWIPGGLGHANVLASIVFSGMSGSAVADAGGLGQIEVDAMIDDGFDPDFSAAVTGASATIGPIIPPSIPMVVYGMMTEVPVGVLFIGGIVPGLLLALATSILIFIMAKKRNYPTRPFNFKEWLIATKEALLSLMTPVIIIGGIWSGVFSPTEAACIAVVYAFFLAVILYKGMTVREIYEALKRVLPYIKDGDPRPDGGGDAPSRADDYPEPGLPEPGPGRQRGGGSPAPGAADRAGLPAGGKRRRRLRRKDPKCGPEVPGQ